MLPYNLIIVTGSMRSGTSLLHRLISTSPDAGPPIAPARYIADQLQIYRRYTGSDRPLSTDYFLSSGDMAEAARGLLRGLLDAAWTNSGKPLCLVIRSVDVAPMIPLVFTLIPEVRFAVSVRDPKDTITSMLKVGRRQKLLPFVRASPAVSRDIPKLCKTYNGAYLPGLRIGRNHSLSERIIFVRYEDAATNPAAALRELWERCEMRPGTLLPQHLDVRTSIRQLASHRYWRTYVTDLHSGPASTESIGSYKLLLEASEARTVDWRCRHVRRAFGYGGQTPVRPRTGV